MNFLFLFALVQFIHSMGYNINTAEIGVWLSGAAYCNKEGYPEMKLTGPASGFQYYETLYDKPTDLQGYTGVIHKTQQIYVVFRGSASLSNWLDDAEVVQIPYETFPDCKCKVHSGFYKSAINIYPQVHASLNDIQQVFPSYSIIVTGHSYGAAVAQLVAMELLANKLTSSVYNYGQPRVGNPAYAKFVNEKLLNIWRFTHYKDMVPHVPPITVLNYYHSCREVYEDETHSLHTCSDIDGEDPNCADQFALYQTDTTDHHVYLNHALECGSSTV
jgi:hypothetical protein